MRALAVAALALLLATPARAQDRGARDRAPAAAAATVDIADWHPAVVAVAPDGTPAAAAWLAGTIGIARHVALDGALFYDGDAASGFHVDEALVQVRVRLLAPRAHLPLAIALGGGYQSDATRDHAALASLAVRAAVGRVDLSLDVRAAHYFGAGRDPIDLFVHAAAMARVSRRFRVGVEYIGEDLEADDGDSGARHYIGPTAALFFAADHVRLGATSGVIVNAAQTAPAARVALAWIY